MLIEGYHENSLLSLGLDWCASGLVPTEENSLDSETLLRSLCGMLGLQPRKFGTAFYQNSWQDKGILITSDPKPGCKNDPISIEFRGAFFNEYGQNFDEILDVVYRHGWSCNLYRVDVRLDIYEQIIPEVQLFGKIKNAHSHTDLKNGLMTGFSIGKSDLRYRIYDKKAEREASGIKTDKEWWRFEVQLRGELLKNQFGGYLSYGSYTEKLLSLGCLFMTDFKRIRVQPAFIQEFLLKIARGEIQQLSQKQISFQQATEFFWETIRQKQKQYIKSMERRFGKNWWQKDFVEKSEFTGEQLEELFQA